MAKAGGEWDPDAKSAWNDTKPTAQCMKRIERDLASLYSDPPHGIFVVADEESITLLHALVIGPFDTPYEGGFFYFKIRCPPDYPIHPPRVKLVTTGNNTVRFNPNLYRNGKVCLSIIGTWAGPSWSPAQSIGCILLSIQSLMNDKPYHNEPGFETERRANDALKYNQIIAHETLRVAVLEMMRNPKPMPDALADMMRGSFPQYYDMYVTNLAKLDALQGTPMADPFGEGRGTFQPTEIRDKLVQLRKTVPFPEDEPKEKCAQENNKMKANDDVALPSANKKKKLNT